MEKELLSVIVTLNSVLRSMRPSKFVYRNLTNQHILRCCLAIENFSPAFHHMHGVKGVIACNLSRLPINDTITEGKNNGKRNSDVDEFGEMHAFDIFLNVY